MLRPLSLRTQVLLVVAALSVAACGGTGSDTTVVPVTATEPPVPTTTASPTTSTTTTTEAGFTQVGGEIFLEPAGSEGPESFTGELFVDQTTPSSTTSTTTATAPAPAPTGPSTVTGVVGDTPALYGGSRDRAVCDKAGQLRFLERNPDKAAAFVAALNGDPNLMWSGGTSLSVAQLADYWDELTPMVLTRDTRVTNHGYRDGRPTPRQAVLQAGTAVLVDAYGVPRTRCECGNPLTPPQPVQITPVYTGPRWPDFSPDLIVVVNQTTVIIDVFVLVDVNTGDDFIRPTGSDGTTDASQQASTWLIDLNATQAEADYFNTTTVAWSGEFTIADDLTISGSGEGTWTFDGDCYESSGDIASTSSSQGTFTVVLVGEVFTTEFGRVANIYPSYLDFAIGSYSGNPPDVECEQDVYDNVESWAAPSFAAIESLPVEAEEVFASYESAGFSGGVTLTPIG